MDSPDISALLEKATGGDEAALRQLLFVYHAKLTAVIDPMIGEKLQVHVSVEDILQETFAAAFADIGSFDRQRAGSFFGWLRAIAANRVRDAARRQGRQKRGGEFTRVGNVAADDSAALDLIVELSDGGASPSGEAARDEALTAIRVGLAALAKDQREAISLHCLDGLSLKETAERMGRSWNSVRGLIQRGKQALREHMKNTSMWFSKQ